MICGAATATASIIVLASGAITGTTDYEGEFLVDDAGTFLVDDSGNYLITNTEIKPIVTEAGDNLVDDEGNLIIEYYADGETTSAPDPE